ncbi:MAG: hypothetical protein HZY76_10445 [Anaerolineae bacterium]|nr:MAG: hypothetical protein HZY76_10445 [Anaerolineae bacterium]
MQHSDEVNVHLSEQEQEMIEILMEDLELPSTDDVIRLLVKQEAQRIAVVCPSCGHYARKTQQDVASCNSCLSIINLSEGIWEVSQMRKQS